MKGELTLAQAASDAGNANSIGNCNGNINGNGNGYCNGNGNDRETVRRSGL